MSQPYKSGRQQNLNLGITSVTESTTVLQTIGKVGIGTTNAQNHSLFVVGSTNITGDVNVGGASTFVGIATFSDDVFFADDVFVKDQLFVNGIQITGGATIGQDLVVRNISASGLSTFVGIVTNQSTIFGTNLSIAGLSTFVGVTTSTSTLFANNFSVAGLSTFVGIVTNQSTIFGTQLSVSGVSTFNNTLNVVSTSTGIAGLFSGTTSSDMVRITQLGTGNALVVEDSANPDATPFVVNASGSVGIGTINPLNSLVVSNGLDGIEFSPGVIASKNRILNVSRNPTLYIEQETIASAFYFSISNPNDNTVIINNSKNVGISTTPTEKLDVNGNIRSSNTLISNQLNVTGISTISVNSSSDALRITQLGTGNALVVEDETNPDATPFVVTASGSVGIGTTIVGGKLHIQSGITTDGGEINLIVSSSDSLNIPATISQQASHSTIQIFSGGMASHSSRGGQIDFIAGFASTNPGCLIFRTGTATTSAPQPERVRVDAIGNIGIGITNPVGSLQVGAGTSTFVVTSTGSVGIGTTNPNYALEVNGGIGATTLVVTGVSTFAGITTVTGPTLFSKQLNVSGVSTFVGLVDANGGAEIDNIRIGIANDNEIDTSTGNLTLDSAGGTTTLDDDVSISGTLGVTGPTTLSSTLAVTGVSTFTGNVTLGGELRGPAEFIIDPAAVGDNTGAVRIKGDLFVDGTQTIINSATIELADFIVGIASTATTDLLADGAGIKIGPDNTLLYDHTNTALKSSENLNLASGKTYKINGTDVLSSTTLGSGVVNSSLTSVGTLGQLNVSGVSTFAGITTNTSTLFANQLSVSGVSTFAGITTITGPTLFSKQLNVSGVSTLATLHAPKLSPDGSDFGGTQYLARADGSGGWTWANVPGIFSVNNILNGFNVSDEGLIVGTAGSITTLDFRGNNIIATADPQPNGIATIRVSDTPSFLTLNVSGISTLAGITTVSGDTLFAKQLSVSGVSTFVGVATFPNSNVFINNQLFVGGVQVNGGAVIGVDIETRHLKATGITTLGVTTASQLFVTGVSTFAGITTVTGDTLFSKQLNVTGVVTASGGIQGIGIQSGGINIATGILTALNFVGAGNSFSYNAGTKTIDINIGGGQWTYADTSNATTSSIYRLNGNVGLGTTNPTSKLHVIGDARITGVLTVSNGIQGIGIQSGGVSITTGIITTLNFVGSAVSTITNTSGFVEINVKSGQFSKNTTSFTATAGQTTFYVTYTPNFIDVFVNGVRLTSSEFVATDASSVVLNEGATAGDIIDVVVFQNSGLFDSSKWTAADVNNPISGNIFKSTGNVGIGTTNPIASLQVGAGTSAFVVTSTGSVGIGTTNPFEKLDVLGILGIGGTTSSISTTTASTIDTLPVTTYRSARFQVQITQGTNYQSTDLMTIHDGTTSNLIEYGTISTGDYLASFSSTISGSNLLLRATMGSAGIATVKVARYGVTI